MTIIEAILRLFPSYRKAQELKRIEELAKQARRVEGAFPPDSVQ